VTGIAFNPGAAEGAVGLAVSGGRKGLLVWNSGAMQPGLAGGRHVLPVFNSSGSYLVSADTPKKKPSQLKWWHPSGGTPTASADALGRICAMVACPSVEEVFACGYDNGIVRLWDFRNGKTFGPVIQADARVPISSLAFSPDGRFLAAASEGSLVSLWLVSVRLWLVPSERLFVADLNGHIEEETGVQPIQGHLVGESEGVFSIASSNGAWFAKGDCDGRIQL
jgi:WD40 repeat protein